MAHRRAIAGVTLIELILTLVILGIVTGTLAPFIAQSARGYSDTRDRNALTAEGRLALERLAREVRHAVPNTLDELDGGNGIAFVSAKYGGRYMSRSDPFPTGEYPEAFRFAKNTPLQGLFILGQDYQYAAGDHLVIYNTVSGELNPNATVALDPPGGVYPGVQLLQFQTMMEWNAEPLAQHFQIADASHAIGRVGNSLRWRRGPVVTGGSLSYGGGDPILIQAEQLEVNFSYSPAALQGNAILRVELTLSRGRQTVTVAQEMQVRNVP